MATNKIYHMSDLPKWFSLNKYEATNKFTTTDWLEQLAHRREILWMLGRSSANVHDRAALMFGKIELEPIQSIFQPESWIVESEIKTVGVSAFVQPLRCGLVHALGQDIEHYYGFNDRGNLGLAAGYSVSKYYKENDSYMSTLVPVTIDLRGSDVDIKNDFDCYLKQAREFIGKKNKKTHITNSDIERLQKYNILPYFDLMIWSAIGGRNIIANVILTALFEADREIQEVGEPFIIKTLKPFYKKIDSRFIRALERYQEPP
jgi:hypothetical protein